MPKPKVSIIIPCRNEKESIEKCLRSILSLREPEGGFEVLVCEGMSKDGTREIIKKMMGKNKRIRLIDNLEKITPCALNKGIESAKGKIIMIMSAHAQYDSNYVVKCVETLEQSDADNVGGPWRSAGNNYLSDAIAILLNSPFSIGGAKGHNENYEGYVDTVCFGCYNKSLFGKIGKFDEKLVRNQDDEFNLRLTLAGGKIWQSPDIKFSYIPRSSLKQLFLQYFQYGYWKVKVIKKHKRPASIRHLVPGVFVLFLISTLATAAFSKTSQILFLIISGLYLSYVFVASLHASIKSNWKYYPVFPILLPCFHFGYGAGFLLGLLDFVILKRKDGRFVKITRKK